MCGKISPLPHVIELTHTLLSTGCFCSDTDTPGKMSEEPALTQSTKPLKRAHDEKSVGSSENDHAAKKCKAEAENADDEKKYPKKKVVLLLAYSGKGYYGMQVHMPVTIITQLVHNCLISIMLHNHNYFVIIVSMLSLFLSYIFKEFQKYWK